MNGYKTIVAALISFLSGAALLAGVELPPELLETLKNNIEAVLGAIGLLYGTIMAILRIFTNGPIGGSNAKG